MKGYVTKITRVCVLDHIEEIFHVEKTDFADPWKALCRFTEIIFSHFYIYVLLPFYLRTVKS
jgi:hypothetical protein